VLVGALPVTGALLREFPGSGPAWHAALAPRGGAAAPTSRPPGSVPSLAVLTPAANAGLLG